MTEVIRKWGHPLFYLSQTDPNAYRQILKLQGIAKLGRATSDASTVDTNGDELQDVLVGTSYGTLAQRHKYRILYDSLNDRFTIQRNTGTDAAKSWSEIFRINEDGDILATGALSVDSLTTLDGGVTLGGTLDFNTFYARNLDKVVGLLRTDRLRVHDEVIFDAGVDIQGGTFYGEQINRGSIPKERIKASAITQHESSISIAASQVTSGQFADARISESSVRQHVTKTVATTSTAQEAISNTEVDLTSFTGLTLPTTTSVSTKTFLATAMFSIKEQAASAETLIIKLNNGADGDKDDTEVEAFAIDVAASEEKFVTIVHKFTPGADSRIKVGFSAVLFSAGDLDFQPSSIRSSTVVIEEYTGA